MRDPAWHRRCRTHAHEGRPALSRRARRHSVSRAVTKRPREDNVNTRVAIRRVVVGIVPDDDAEVRTRVGVGIPPRVRLIVVALIAQEARVAVRLSNAVLDEIECVRCHLPVGDERRHVVVDGEVGILVDRLSNTIQVPTILARNELEPRKVEWEVRGHDEEIPDAGVLAHDPLGGLREKQAVVTAATCPSVGARMGGMNQRDPAVGIDPEDHGIGVR